MDARAKSVRDILRAGDQYLVPFFQRHYSWKLTQWERLMQDLVALLKRTKGGVHFIGPLVCTPFESIPGEVQRFQLIDGQQRLTTLSVLLAAIRDLAQEHGLNQLVEEINEEYLINKRHTGVYRYKVVPRVGDRQILFSVIDRDSAAHSRRDGIIRAHRFFLSSVRAMVHADPATELRALLTAVTGRLSLVMVTIDSENPYDIFDSLNSTGLPLEQSDLIRNFVFMSIPMAKQQTFNDQSWQPIEAMFDEAATDPAKLMTAFYRDYLMHNGTFSEKGATYTDFRENIGPRLASSPPETLAAEVRSCAKYDLMIRVPSTASDEVIQHALRRLTQMKVATAYPLVLQLLRRWGSAKLTQEDLLRCLTDIESFVIRRLVCGESNKSYDEWFCDAIKSLGDDTRTDLHAYLLRRGWPDDEAFVPSLTGFALYRRDPSKCRAILESLEESFKHKESPDLEKLTIEHVMPQTIGDDVHGRGWQEMLGASWKLVHETQIDTLGNLTLTGYNSELSNRRFDRKQTELKKSHVELNRHFDSLDKWNGKTILKRGATLAAKVAEIWPRPDSDDHPWRPRHSDAAITNVDADADEAAEDVLADYWKAFRVVLSSADAELEPVEARGDLLFDSDRYGCKFQAFTDEDQGWIGIAVIFRGKHRAANLRIVKQDHAAIEAELGQPLEWIDNEEPVCVAAYLDASRVTDRAHWAEQHAWLLTTLQKFITVFTPRLVTEMDAEHRKSLHQEFWEGFDELRRTNGSIDEVDLGNPGSKSSRESELSKSFSLWVEFGIEDNYLGIGLTFQGKKALSLFEAARSKTAPLAAALNLTIELDEFSDYSQLTTYRYINPLDRPRWPAHSDWLSSAISEYLKFFKDVTSTETASAPTA